MNIAVEKEEIIKWVSSLENPMINTIRKKEAFNFEKEWGSGITIEEARKRTHDFIKSLP